MRKSLVSVAERGIVRRRLATTGRGTRRTGQLGSTLVTGVGRRVHAPLGTVMNFTSLLSVVSSRGRRRRCVKLVRDGARRLLQLVGSIVSLSGVRSNIVSVINSSMILSSLVGRVRLACIPGTRAGGLILT